jgi:peptide/nickel transport system permease protein
MPTYVIRRVAIAVIAFFVISLIIFFSVNLILTPFQRLFGPGTIYIDPQNQEDINRLNELMESRGLYDPLPIQYLRWIGGFFTGNWGESLMGESYYTK